MTRREPGRRWVDGGTLGEEIDPRQPFRRSVGGHGGHATTEAQEAKLSLRLQIELVYDPGCPNVDRARDILTEACRDVGAPAVWTEWSSDDSACPNHLKGLGSPSILVNGEDVAPGPHPWTEREDGDGPRCRVYRDGDALVPAPPLARVVGAIGKALQPDVG